MDVGIAVVLQVDVDAGAVQAIGAEGGSAAVLADIVHGDAGDERVVEGFDVDALLGDVVEGGAVDGDVVGAADAVGHGLGEVDANIDIRNRAAVDRQIGDAGRGSPCGCR